MDSFLFAVNAVLPIILAVAVGYCLKRFGMISPTFVKEGNKLVFRVFLPAMLFLNIYEIESVSSVSLGYVLYAAAIVLLVFLIGIPLVMFLTDKDAHRGPLLQGTFRSNYALVGIPLATALFGETGAIAASLLSAVIVPLYNTLAVVSLSIFKRDEKTVSVKKILLDIVKNPLIVSIVIGLSVLGVRALFLRFGLAFRLSDIAPVYTLLGYLSRVATPMALILLGAQFEFSQVSGYRREIVFATLTRAIAVPVIGIGSALLFFRTSFGGAEFASLVACFATPVAVSSVPMTQEMKGDVVLAGQIVIFTTVASAFTVFIATVILRAIGIF